MKLALKILFCLLVSSQMAIAQRVITGTVSDADSKEYLIGAAVQVAGTNVGAVTDVRGAFTLTVPDTAGFVVVSYVGYDKMTVSIAGQSSISVELKPGKDLDEVIVTGYTTEKKADLTGAVSVADLSKTKDLPPGNIVKNLQGRIAGVFVTTDGSPGSGATVRIRGNGTLNNNDPLYIIDGIPTKSGMHELNSADIESFQVLKDAASASIYGARAANGVIVITTKKGKGKEMKIDFSTSFSYQRYASKLSPLNTQERGMVFFKASVNSKLSPVSPIYQYQWNGDFANPILGNMTIGNPGFGGYIDAQRTMLPANTRWFDEVSQNSILRNYSLTLSKGSDNGNMVFSLGYYDHDGIIKETNFKRFNTRINSDYKFLDGLITVGENFQITYQKESLVNAGDVLSSSLTMHPIVPVYTEKGGWGGPVSGMTDRQNPVRLIEDNKQNYYQYVRPFGNVYVDIKPVKNLTIRSSFGVDYAMYYSRTIFKKYTSGFLSDPDNKLSTNTDLKGNWIWTNTANYKVENENHALDVLLGTEQIKYKQESFFGSRENYINEDLNYAYLGSGENEMLNGGGGTVWAMSSVFAKLNYNFKEKYLVSLTLRRDGSSRFGKNNRFGNFPAASVGWRITEEGFLKNLVPKDLDIKARYSLGQNGNQEIDPLAVYNAYRAVYGKEDIVWDNPRPPYFRPNLGTAYDIAGQDGGQLPSGFIVTQQANDNLIWETTTQSNFGVDVSYKKFSGSLDYYTKETKDILYFRTLIAAVGEASGQFVNGGTIRNSGIEMVLSYKNTIGKLGYDVSVNGATLKNKVVNTPDNLFISTPISNQVPNDAKINLPGQMLVGRSINSIYGYQAEGLFQNHAEVDAHATQPGKGIGRIRYKDLNGDGIIDNNDQTFIGNTDPSIQYGLNLGLEYGNFSLAIFFQGVTGIKYYNSYKTFTDFAGLWPGTNWGDRTLDAWSATNTSSTIPALSILDNNNEGRVSTYFLEDASYLKLRNVQLGYKITGKWMEKSRIKSFRLFVQSQNVLLWKSKEFTAPDPENPNYAFPIPIVFTGGLNVTF
mgnify:CR=1 FL=1